MNAFRAVKADFLTETPPLRVPSRDVAISAALDDPEQVSVHEQVVDPMVYRAASELIRLDDEGHKTDAEAQGAVFEVLQTIESKLMEVGASRFAASQILETLAAYVTGLGADFARQAKAKPLYARVIVTDKEPEDIPDCKLSSVTCIDGNRVQGDDAGRMSMTLTLYGTSNAMSQGMSMQRIFESGKKKWLMIYYGTIEGADLNKFDTIDADLATLIQAVGAGGAASVEEIRNAIEQGTLPSEIMELINKVAELNRAVEAARTPGAIENPEQKIVELKAAIVELSQAIPDMQALPQVLIQAVVQSIESADAAFAKPGAAVVEAPSNDNDTVSEQTQSVLEQITALQENGALPPETKEKLTALLEEAGAALSERNFAQLETIMTGIKESLTEFAASDAASPQIFRTISEILPAVVVAEKQIAEAVARPPVVEGVKQETAADAIPTELAETIAALQIITADKIDVILKDENVAPEVKEKLREMVKTIETAIEQKDFSQLAVVVAEMRRSLTDLAVSNVLPPQVSRSIVEALPVLSAANQKFTEVLPRMLAEKILEAITLTGQKMQSGDIKLDVANPQLSALLSEIKETVKTGGPDAAIQKIVESLKTPVADGKTNSIIEVLVKQPSLLQSLPLELKDAVVAAIPVTDINLRVQLGVMGVETPLAISPEKITQSIDTVIKQIQEQAKADPSMQEVAKILVDLKETIKNENPQVVVQKLVEILKAPTQDGGAHPLFEAIVKQPALLAAMPLEMKQILSATIPPNDVTLRTQLAVIGLEFPKTPLPQKFNDAFDVVFKQAQAEAKLDPAKQDIVKILTQLKDTVKLDNPTTVAQKIIETLKNPSLDGKPHPLIQALAKQPALLQALPLEAKQLVIAAIPPQDTVLRAQMAAIGIEPPRIVPPEQFAATIDNAIRQIQVESRIDPAKREIVEILTQLKEAVKLDGSAGAALNLADTLKVASIEGKLPLVIDKLVDKPELLKAIPLEARQMIVQTALASGELSIKQHITLLSAERPAPIPVVAEAKISDVIKSVQPDKMVQSVLAVEKMLDKADPATKEIIKILGDVRQTAMTEGNPAAVQKIMDAIVRAPDGQAPRILETLVQNREVFAALPRDVQQAFVQTHETIRALPPVSAAENTQAVRIIEAFDAIDRKIQSGEINKFNRENVEIINTIRDIKEAIRSEGPQRFMETLKDSLANPSTNPNAVPLLATITPEVLRAMPLALQQPIIEMQRATFAASALETTLAKQIVPVSFEQKREIQALVNNSALSATEREQFTRALQNNQTSVETLRNIMQRVEVTTPSLNTNNVRTGINELVLRAAADMDTRKYEVRVNPDVSRQVLSSLVNLPIPTTAVREFSGGGPVSIKTIATVIAAAGERPSREVNHFIQTAKQQVLVQEARPLINYLKNNPIPAFTQRDLLNLMEGKPIPAIKIQLIKEQVPPVVAKELDKYNATQKILSPPVSSITVKRELADIQKVLTFTNPVLARHVENFRSVTPNPTIHDVTRLMESLPVQSRQSFDSAAEKVRAYQEPHFLPADRGEFVQILQERIHMAGPQDRFVMEDMINRARLGDPIPRSDLEQLGKTVLSDANVHERISSGLIKVDAREGGIAGTCPGCPGGDCASCKNAHLLSLAKKEARDMGLEVSQNSVVLRNDLRHS